MYGGQIVDPRELASLEKELHHDTTERDALEERCLLAMERVESLQEAVAVAARQVEEARQRWETEGPAQARQVEQLAGDLADLRAERDALAASIDPRSFRLYERLRASTGHAVSLVSDGVCQWCRVAIPPKDVQHARSGALVTCTNCQRILFAGR
jgi:predicted  nucleic acid-binding Zn-ribbon protein